MELKLLVSIVVPIAISLLALFNARYKSRELADLAQKVAVLEKQMALFWAVAEKQMISNLHSPSHYERDLLLDKMRSERLSKDEAFELAREIAELMKQKPDHRGELLMYFGALVAKYDLEEMISE